MKCPKCTNKVSAFVKQLRKERSSSIKYVLKQQHKFFLNNVRHCRYCDGVGEVDELIHRVRRLKLNRKRNERRKRQLEVFKSVA